MLGFKILILWIGLLASGFGSDSNENTETENGFSTKDGAFYTDDAVIITAHVGRQKREASNSTRDGKQLILLHRQTDEGAFGLECETMMGKRGSCMSFHECYPLFKVGDMSSWDGWAMGHYDTCSYINAANMEVFGVCCTQQNQPQPAVGLMQPAMPMAFPPLGFPGNVAPLFPRQWDLNNGVGIRQIPAVWPPPIPTHPPDHTAPTHPPVAGITTKPTPINKPQTTWPTRPPFTTKPTQATWQPSQPSKPILPTKPTLPNPPTQPGSFSKCGVKNGPQTYGSTDTQDEERIVGGHNAELNEWPWIVALFNSGRQFCGGSLIDSTHVLSAAHCVAHMSSWDVARLTARLGDYNIKTNAETQHIERKIKRVVRHRGFDMRTLYNDISILTLDQPVQFTKNIRPICLPGGSRAYSGLVATVIGWGSLRESGPQPSILQEVSIPIWTNSECRLKYGAAAPGGIVEHMICAGKASMDSCSGDSGGPLMVNEGGTWDQVGVVSWGIGCGKGQYPGVYTRVTSFLPWIEKNSKQ